MGTFFFFFFFGLLSLGFLKASPSSQALRAPAYTPRSALVLLHASFSAATPKKPTDMGPPPVCYPPPPDPHRHPPSWPPAPVSAPLKIRRKRAHLSTRRSTGFSPAPTLRRCRPRESQTRSSAPSASRRPTTRSKSWGTAPSTGTCCKSWWGAHGSKKGLKPARLLYGPNHGTLF